MLYQKSGNFPLTMALVCDGSVDVVDGLVEAGQSHLPQVGG